jgi:hypothetical protein
MEEKYQGKVRVHALRDIYYSIHLDVSLIPMGFNKKLGKYVLYVNI